MRQILSDWQSPLPRLLVFDNCEDAHLLALWRPPSGGSRLLVTSRQAAWDPALGIQAIALEVLSRPESLALLAASGKICQPMIPLCLPSQPS